MIYALIGVCLGTVAAVAAFNAGAGVLLTFGVFTLFGALTLVGGMTLAALCIAREELLARESD